MMGCCCRWRRPRASIQQRRRCTPECQNFDAMEPIIIHPSKATFVDKALELSWRRTTRSTWLRWSRRCWSTTQKMKMRSWQCRINSYRNRNILQKKMMNQMRLKDYLLVERNYTIKDKLYYKTGLRMLEQSFEQIKNWRNKLASGRWTMSRDYTRT